MNEKKLRNGYTTGACASAAAKAAAIFVCHGMRKGRSVGGSGTEAYRIPDEVELTLPEGSRVRWKVAACEEAGREGYFFVRKDSGDDPDVTNGVRVYARVEPIDQGTMETLRREGSGYWLEKNPKQYLAGVSGIGLVTREGLSCPVGHVAINPVPRRMILSAVHEVCREADVQELFQVTVAIPDGVWLAKKTFNPKLGIVGGLSVLG
ncbi:MAG: cobalt-precorrin-5B (C(1))-methyltransferase, partial [Clostridiales bacterium]|nr:cobalt-precorrin-5B (C(1))-methyltransferase [Clostridiales bacterium]